MPEFPSADFPQGASPPPMDDEYATGYRFSITKVISLTFFCLAKNPLLYLCLGICVTLPGMVIHGVAEDSPAAGILAAVFDLFFSVIFAGAIAFGVYQNMLGRQARFGEAVSRGLARYFSLVGVSILYTLGLALLVMIAILIPVFGLVVAGIAILYALPVLSVIIPACAVEGIGPTASFRRSVFLTRGHGLAIFGLFFLLILMFAVMVLLGEAFFGERLPGVNLLDAILQPTTTALSQVLMAVLYYQLRIAKEGVGVDRLASVFE